MKNNFRCDCPLTSAIDIIGDKWTLVIIKQMLLQNKETFKDFTDSEEAIATNILTVRMKNLIELNLVTKSKLPNNKKSVYYHLTEKGLSLAPIIIELALWAGETLKPLNSTMIEPSKMGLNQSNKEEYIINLVANYKEKLATTQN
jgi:DNA-binding HxlR family transcriptional regulator|uniref:winged helix-turn-helix transcriptional regulator n=1 Tax=Algoriphagus sp. TaxID=1872435 RepID=UPI004047CB2E